MIHINVNIYKVLYANVTLTSPWPKTPKSKIELSRYSILNTAAIFFFAQLRPVAPENETRVFQHLIKVS
ncbi:hypothetical protein L1887_31078 [Cichorium endivia]|nr:hypothetical protein L1887_31078 [Cichorium endivia]